MARPSCSTKWENLTTDVATPAAPLEGAELRALLDRLKEHQTGLLVTIDEIHRGVGDDLRHIAALTQHMIREDREFAVAMAGLPAAVSALLSDDVTTFLRRADKHVLADVDVDEVEVALGETVAEAGRSIEPEALRKCAEATYGYPFLIQLVGYHMWRSATGDHIGIEAADQGIDAARRRLGSLVHEPGLADLSDVDRTFLAAMALDDGPSQIADVIVRMGVGNQYANVYRTRLIEAEMIHSAGRGRVDFALQYSREYLRDHAVTLGLTDPTPPGRSGIDRGRTRRRGRATTPSPSTSSSVAIQRPVLHAGLFCRWTLQTETAEDVRSEALNLIRNRKGWLPHIAVVIAEPLPSRLASIALGIGDIDWVQSRDYLLHIFDSIGIRSRAAVMADLLTEYARSNGGGSWLDLAVPAALVVFGKMLTTHAQKDSILKVVQWPYVRPRDLG